MAQAFRIENGGLINRDKKLSFKFNGKTYFGFLIHKVQQILKRFTEQKPPIYEQGCWYRKKTFCSV